MYIHIIFYVTHILYIQKYLSCRCKCICIYVNFRYICICYVFKYHVPYEWVMAYTCLFKVHTWNICSIGMWCYEWVMSHMNWSCPIWMSHVPYEWVMPHTNESCHIWMSHVPWLAWGAHLRHLFNRFVVWWMGHVPCEWVMSHINESCLPMKTSHDLPEVHTCNICSIGMWCDEWVMSHMNWSCSI